jgi:hypothetical protein
MRVISVRYALIVATICWLSTAHLAAGATLSYSVNPTLSSLQFAIYIFGTPANGGTLLTAPQTLGSDITSLGGTLLADVSGGTISLPGGSAVTFANQPIDQEPDIGGGPSSGVPGPPAPAQYGLNVILIDSGPVALRGLLADLTSPGGPIGLLAGTFNAGQVTLGTTAGSADYNLVGAATAFGNSSLAGQSGPNDPGLGTVTTLGGITTITIPISVDVPLVVSGIPLDAIFTGQIVASLPVPEPSTLILAGLSLLGLASVIRSRKKMR